MLFSVLLAMRLSRILPVVVLCPDIPVVSATRLPLVAFAGGGFGASTPKKGKTKNSKKKRRLLADVSPPKPEKEEPILDKWGLPPPTIEDIFPPLPEGTELITATKDEYSLSEINNLMQNHLDMQLDNFFDENGVEKSSSEQPMKLRVLHESPPVLAIDNFFTQQQCVAVEQVAMPAGSSKVNPEEVVEVNSKTFSLSTAKRTSTSWFCRYRTVPVLLSKAHHALGIPFEHMEEPQIVRYQTGQEFSWHCDEVPPPQLANGGQRLATLLVYLNTVDKGGGTIFRDLKGPDGNMLGMQPKQGSALLFFPAFRDGKTDDRTLHKGEMAANEKRIVQMWIHERDYQAAVPSGNLQEDALSAVQETSRLLGYVD